MNKSIEEKIIIDGNKTLILINNEKYKINNERRSEEIKVKISHYTDLKGVLGMLNSNQVNGMYAKSLYNYNSEKFFYDDENSAKQCFIISFYKETEESKEMWNDFKKNDTTNCKLDFYLKNNKNLTDLFDLILPLSCYNKKDKIFTIKKNGAAYNNKESIQNITYDLMIRPVEYDVEKTNKTNMIVNEENYTLVDNIARYVDNKFSYQKEVRYIFFLRSIKKVEISYFDKLLIPFNSDAIDSIVITTGPRFNDKNMSKIIDLIKQASLNVKIERSKYVN
jgi:hypothetical protein